MNPTHINYNNLGFSRKEKWHPSVPEITLGILYLSQTSWIFCCISSSDGMWTNCWRMSGTRIASTNLNIYFLNQSKWFFFTCKEDCGLLTVNSQSWPPHFWWSGHPPECWGHSKQFSLERKEAQCYSPSPSSPSPGWWAWWHYPCWTWISTWIPCQGFQTSQGEIYISFY